MKNKEIEELLNEFKEGTYLFPEYREIILSYIEQLEKRNKELYEGFMATQEELTDYATENEQLENKYDKAIEYLIEIRKSPSYELDEKIDNLEEILKGDSDE